MDHYTFPLPTAQPRPRGASSWKAFSKEIDEFVDKVAEMTALPKWSTAAAAAPPKPGYGGVFVSPFGPASSPSLPQAGDRVTLELTAYVRRVNGDGTVELAATREPFAEPIVLDHCHPSRARLIERDNRPPVTVGDTIDGRTVRETAWKRGTVLKDVTPTQPTYGDLLALNADGTFVNVTAGRAGVPFSAFDDESRFVVELAPGK